MAEDEFDELLEDEEPRPIPKGPGRTGQFPKKGRPRRRTRRSPLSRRRRSSCFRSGLWTSCWPSTPTRSFLRARSRFSGITSGIRSKEKRTRAERQAAADAITSEASWATEQEYVDFQLEVTKAQFERLPEAPDTKITMADRLARTERYARWRWQAFLAGEVASL